MTSDTLLAIIFIIILIAAGIVRIGLKRPLPAKVILGIGALALTGIAYTLNNNTVPTWILALSGILILVDAWFSKEKQK
jgi:hypothetical protein